MEKPVAYGVQGTLLAHSRQTSTVFLRSAKYRGPTAEPCGAPSLADLTKTLLAQISQTPKRFLCRARGPTVNQRETLVLPSGKSNYLWTKWDILNYANQNAVTHDTFLQSQWSFWCAAPSITGWFTDWLVTNLKNPLQILKDLSSVIIFFSSCSVHITSFVIVYY